jgi:LysM repeat protein
VGSNPTLSAMVNRMRRVLVCAVIATCSLGTVVPSAQAANCAATYTVKSGDSWWRIAEKNNTNLRKVLTLNKAKKTTKLLVGSTVCVPAPAQVVPPAQKFTRAEVVLLRAISDLLSLAQKLATKCRCEFGTGLVESDPECKSGLSHVSTQQWLWPLGVTIYWC